MSAAIPPPKEPVATVPRPDPEVLRLRRQSYWYANLALLGALLTVWALVSFGAGILFVDVLDEVRLPGSGFPLGFWFAQQGSIYCFVGIIFTYVILMNRLDRRFGFDD